MSDPPQIPTRTFVEGAEQKKPVGARDGRRRRLAPVDCVPTTRAFFQVAAKSQLVQLDDLNALRAEFRGQEDATPEPAAARLVEKGLVTRWQSQQLLAGKSLFFLGRYRFLDRIGIGGMGAVFKAEHEMMNRVVALKVIRRSLLKEPKTLQRFLREIKVVASLMHPHIVTAHDADCVGDTYFLVMEYINGKDLDWWVRRHGPFPVKWACDFCRQAALGLQHAYEQGLCHRDIKPKNLLAVREKPETPPVIKILDFGLARVFNHDDETNLNSTAELVDDSVVGTFGFMAPEQFRRPTEVDIRSDVFALGSTLFYLLTGGLPFRGKTEQEFLASLFDKKVPMPLRKFVPQAPPGVEQIVNKMLSFDMEDRFQTPLEVAEVLSPFSASTIKSFAGANAPIPVPPAVAGPAQAVDLHAGVDMALGEFSDRLTDHPVAPEGAGIDSLIQGTSSEPAPEIPQLETQAGWSERTVRRRSTTSKGSKTIIAVASGMLLIGALLFGLWALTSESVKPPAPKESQKDVQSP